MHSLDFQQITWVSNSIYAALVFVHCAMCMRSRLVRVWKIPNVFFEVHIAFQFNRFVCHCLIRLECVQSVLVFAKKQKHLFEFDVFEMRLNVHAFSTKREFLIKLTYIHPNYAIWNRTHSNKMTFWCWNSMWLEINQIWTSIRRTVLDVQRFLEAKSLPMSIWSIFSWKF